MPNCQPMGSRSSCCLRRCSSCRRWGDRQTISLADEVLPDFDDRAVAQAIGGLRIDTGIQTKLTDELLRCQLVAADVAGARAFDTEEGEHAPIKMDDHAARRRCDWRRRKFGAILVHHVVAPQVGRWLCTGHLTAPSAASGVEGAGACAAAVPISPTLVALTNNHLRIRDFHRGIFGPIILTAAATRSCHFGRLLHRGAEIRQRPLAARPSLCSGRLGPRSVSTPVKLSRMSERR